MRSLHRLISAAMVCYAGIPTVEISNAVRCMPLTPSPLSPQIRSKLDQVAARLRPNLRGEGEPVWLCVKNFESAILAPRDATFVCYGSNDQQLWCSSQHNLLPLSQNLGQRWSKWRTVFARICGEKGAASFFPKSRSYSSRDPNLPPPIAREQPGVPRQQSPGIPVGHPVAAARNEK